MIHPNDPAFPHQASENDMMSGGLTVRQYFAAAALTGLLADARGHGLTVDGCTWGDVGATAVRGADALIAALNAETPAPADVNADAAYTRLLAGQNAALAASLNELYAELEDKDTNSGVRAQMALRKAGAW